MHHSRTHFAVGLGLLLLLAGGAWRFSAAASGIRTVRPVEIDVPLPNPHMGWGIWTGKRYYDGTQLTVEQNTAAFGDDAPLFGWVVIDWMWRDLEPVEGRFVWDELDAIMGYWKQRGKQIYLRIWMTDDPGWDKAPGSEVCPEWLWAKGARYREYRGEGGSRKREPDYVHPSYTSIYLPELRKFLTILASRYDKPELPILFWGVMGYGQWGEWHTLWSKFPWPNAEVKHRILSQVVELYNEVFKVHPLCISYAYDGDFREVRSVEDFMHRQALDVAVRRGFGLARHAFIDGLRNWDRGVMEQYWRRLPMLAEGSWSYADMKTQGSHGTLEENLDVMLLYHSNFAHFYMEAKSYRQAMREDREQFARGLQSGGLGYRLVPTEVSWRESIPAGQILVLRQKWVNRNAGRCYGRLGLRMYLEDHKGNERYSQNDPAFDPSRFVQGETYAILSMLHLPRNLAPGEYTLKVALVDPKGKPGATLGIEGVDPQMKYKLGTVQITAERNGAQAAKTR